MNMMAYHEQEQAEFKRLKERDKKSREVIKLLEKANIEYSEENERLKEFAKELIGFIEHSDDQLCNCLIDDCGYIPEKEKRYSLIDLIKHNDLKLDRLLKRAREIQNNEMYKELKNEVADISEEDIINLFTTSPKTLQRPILLHNGKAAIGRPNPDNILSII